MKLVNGSLISAGLFVVMASGLAHAAEPKVTVFKTPACGCCNKWVTHLEENGFDVETVDMRDLSMIKSLSGVTPELGSCHTAQVAGYTVEGHVPADDIKRLLHERPDVKGLTVPGMPHGSPGMETGREDRYQVLTFDENGRTEVFSRH